MIYFSKLEQEIICIINNFKKDINKIDYTFQDVFQDILLKKYPKVSINISENSINFQIIGCNKLDKEDIELETKILELILLIFKLQEKNLLIFIEIDDNYKNTFKYKFIKTNPSRVLYLKTKNDYKKLLELLYSKVYVTSDLKQIIEDEFTNIELKTLKITRTAFLGSIFINLITLGLMTWLAYKVPVTINFEANEQFEKLVSSKKINVTNENSIIIPETLYKPKIELKLEIFR